MNAMPPIVGRQKPRVLCVDDSPDLAFMVSRMVRSQTDLEDAGTLPNVDDVVSAVERCGATVVVMDLTMPGRPPLDAIRELRARFAWCKVIAYSGYDDAATVDGALRAGAWAVVSKHSEFADLLIAIRGSAE